MAEFLLKGDEAQGLADGAQGDEEGMMIDGGVKKAVEANAQKVEALKQSGELGLVLAAAFEVQVPGEMLEVAAESRRGETMLFAQGAAGLAPEELAVDLRAACVIADGAAFVHGETVLRWRFAV